MQTMTPTSTRPSTRPPTWLYIVVCLFVALNGADLLLTHYLVSTGDGVEANPIMAPIVETLWLFVLIKIGYPMFIGWRVLRRSDLKKVVVGLVIWTVLFVGIVAWNTHLLLVRG